MSSRREPLLRHARGAALAGLEDAAFADPAPWCLAVAPRPCSAKSAKDDGHPGATRRSATMSAFRHRRQPPSCTGRHTVRYVPPHGRTRGVAGGSLPPAAPPHVSASGRSSARSAPSRPARGTHPGLRAGHGRRHTRGMTGCSRTHTGGATGYCRARTTLAR